MNQPLKTAAAVLALLAAAPASAVVVNELKPTADCATMAAGEWCINLQAGAGTAAIVDLTGAGGDLENNQPRPIGAVRLSTGGANADRAEIATNVLVNASSFLRFAQVGYSYYKELTGGANENPSAAPSLKLAIFSNDPGCAGQDCFGQLIYEPYWNQNAGGAALPPADAWQHVLIESSTGAGGTGDGGWWWTGGFGEPSGGGGPPIRSLGEWNALFSGGALSGQFATASVIGISVGLGTFNADNVGYVDHVRYEVPEVSEASYDFEPAANVLPEPGILALLGVGLLALGFRRKG